MRIEGNVAEAKGDRKQIPRCGYGALREATVSGGCQRADGKEDIPHSAVSKTCVAAEMEYMGNE